MSEPLIIKSVSDQVAVLTFNRPKVLNALNSAVMTTLINELKACDQDDDIKVIVITGNERAFAAGADIAEMQDRTASENLREDFFGLWQHTTTIRKPMIAAVQGYALGGGLEVAMMADMLIADTQAKFGQPEITLGVMPGMGATQRLTKLIGRARAMDLCLTGRLIDANEALSCGLVSRVLEQERFMDAVIKIAQDMASFPVQALMMNKEAIHVSEDVSLAQGLLFERRVFQALFATEDQKEGMQAFLAKRKPQFQNK